MTMDRLARRYQRANGLLMAREINTYTLKLERQSGFMPLTCVKTLRAGDGNRTRMTSLEGWSSTIELRPQQPPDPGGCHCVAYRLRPAEASR
jgi:hypothetical protein